MKSTVRKSLSIGVVAVATLAQLVLAGVASWTRSTTEREAELELATTANYAAQLAAAERKPPGAVDQRVVQPTLLANPDVAGTLRVLQTIGDTAGITLVSVKASKSTTAGRQTFVVAGRGAPDRVCAFVANVEQHARLMVIESGKVTPGTADEVGFELGLSTHHAGGGK